MGIQLFSNDVKESDMEMTGTNPDNTLQAETLQAEIMQARKKLMESEAKMMELQRKLDDYLTKERQIAEVMIAAQISAQKTEAQARARAEVILQETEETLRIKQRELELLQLKAQLFKEDILDKLDLYKSSVEKIMTIADDSAFTPSLVCDEKQVGQKLIG
ncbi:MAG: hypothetical protein ABRQ24_08290 [Syntrophomonadaceae bacterium]